MSDWKQVAEEGQVFWVHEEHGNVLKAGDGVYISMLPKVIRLGPFETLEQAQSALANGKQALEAALDEFNDKLLSGVR
jgi:hypothetical protein